jgi:short-subunit dehydrogenase
MNPSDKTVIITGASAGIGAATARVFAAAGANVVLAARDATKLEALARGLAGRALAVPTDVADRAAVTALMEQTVAAFGGVDIVINNAGVGLAAPVADLSFEDFQRALSVDLFGPLALTQAALPYMRRRGRGQLIYVSSVVGLRALPYLGGYAAAKAALDRLTEALRIELRGSGVDVTVVFPGVVATDIRIHGYGPDGKAAGASGLDEKGAMSVQECARLIAGAMASRRRELIMTAKGRLGQWIKLIAPSLVDRIALAALNKVDSR